MRKYAKALVAIVGAVLTSAATVYPNAPEWLPIVTTFVTAVGVYLVPNLPE